MAKAAMPSRANNENATSTMVTPRSFLRWAVFARIIGHPSIQILLGCDRVDCDVAASALASAYSAAPWFPALLVLVVEAVSERLSILRNCVRYILREGDHTERRHH